MDWVKLQKRLDSFKYPLLVLALGLVLMLLPGRGKETTAAGDSALTELLGDTEGVGRVYVAVSENGAVIVCDGAESAKVRLDILHAVASYTGYGADRITVLKMTERKGR